MIRFLFKKNAPPTEGDLRRRVRYAEEQAAIPKNKIELLARAYCKELGRDPDLCWFPGPMIPSVPLWRKYQDKAEAALAPAAMQAALRKIGETE
jgi:hypothetical protein